MTTRTIYAPLPAGQTDIAVPSDYIDTSFIKVYSRDHATGLGQSTFAGTLLSLGTHYSWLNEGTIRLTSPADGLTDYLVARETQVLPLVEQQPGVFSSAKANLAVHQALHLAEEAKDLMEGVSDLTLRNDLFSVVSGKGASLVSYQSPLASSLPTQVGERMNDWASAVADYGYSGGGVVDDTLKDDAARAALVAAGGGVLVFAPKVGGYKVHGANREPGILIVGRGWPGFDHVGSGEPPGPLRVYTKNEASSPGKVGISSIMVNGTETPFTFLGYGDSVALGTWVFSGPDAPNPVCVHNVGSRYRGVLPPGINWGIEIDMNNEATSTYTSGDARGGQALVINTGSTYSPDSGIVIQRAQGEGSGPGYKVGMRMKGVRDIGVLFEAMSPITYPSMSPSAPGTLAAIVSRVSNEAYNRFTMSESGRMDWGDGSSPQDVYLVRSGALSLFTNGTFNAIQYWCGSNNVVGARRTGWELPTNTVSRATFDTASVTVSQLAQRVGALIADLHASAGHGLIGA